MTRERLQGVTEFSTEEKLDDLLTEYLKDFKEGSLECKGWPISPLSAYIVSKVAINARMPIQRLWPGSIQNSVSIVFALALSKQK